MPAENPEQAVVAVVGAVTRLVAAMAPIHLALLEIAKNVPVEQRDMLLPHIEQAIQRTEEAQGRLEAIFK